MARGKKSIRIKKSITNMRSISMFDLLYIHAGININLFTTRSIIRSTLQLIEPRRIGSVLPA